MFICGLFNGAVGIPDCIVLNRGIHSELERMWNETDVAYFEILSRIYLDGLMETTENLSQDIQSSAEISTRDLPNTLQEWYPLNREIRSYVHRSVCLLVLYLPRCQYIKVI
jgi:hypothetical protein